MTSWVTAITYKGNGNDHDDSNDTFHWQALRRKTSPFMAAMVPFLPLLMEGPRFSTQTIKRLLSIDLREIRLPPLAGMVEVMMEGPGPTAPLGPSAPLRATADATDTAAGMGQGSSLG